MKYFLKFEGLEQTGLGVVVGLIMVIFVLCGCLLWPLGGNFVAGRYGEKCYVNGQEHGNIEHKIYFNTLKNCTEYINNY